VAELRNVIVFALGGSRLATELRWVREVATLGFVTEVPTAPPGIAGVVNLHGAILPVLDLAVLHQHGAPVPARQGDGALVVEVEGVAAALRVDQVDEVATLATERDVAPGAEHVIDARGRALPLLDPRDVLRRAGEAVAEAAGATTRAVQDDRD
jgi:chemotaxis signal transduction protein